MLKYYKAKSATLMIIAAEYHTAVFNVSKFSKIVDEVIYRREIDHNYLQ